MTKKTKQNKTNNKKQKEIKRKNPSASPKLNTFKQLIQEGFQSRLQKEYQFLSLHIH